MWENDTSFYKDVNKYEKKDGVFAILLFGIMCVLYALLAALDKVFTAINSNILFVGCVFNALIVVITICFVKARRESFASIGLYGGQWRKSILVGGLLATLYFFNNCLSHILAGASFIPVKDIFVAVIYYLLVSLSEEVVFRGYVGTRLYGFTKNKYLVVVLSGVLFILMHFPYRMVAYGMTIADLTVGNVGWIVDLFVTHVIFSLICLRTNSLWGSILPHWMSNLAYNIVAR